jgi:hypothetical protein
MAANIPLPPGNQKYVCYAAANGGQLIKTGIGSLQSITFGLTGVTVTLYDGLTAGGTLIGVFTSTAAITLTLGVQYNTGLFAVVTGASGTATATVVYW